MADLLADITAHLGTGAPVSAAPVNLPPAMVGKYERVRVVGKGSFGEAVLVRGRQDRQNYISKEVNMHQMTAKERQEAVNEISVLSQLHHPNIIRYYESFCHNDVLYIVMEFADAGDLWTFIQRRTAEGRRLTEAEVLNFFTQTCQALKHMHDRRMLHRDLKTGNVFLTTRGEAKLGDFGISKALRNTAAFATTMCGTPNYFSPEICQGKPYNNKSDIWALGCILAELMTGHLAFQGATMQELYLRVINCRMPPLPDCFSRELRSLCMRILCQQQAMRPDINAILRSYVLQQFQQDRAQDQVRQQQQQQLQQQEKQQQEKQLQQQQQQQQQHQQQQEQERLRQQQQEREREREQQERERRQREQDEQSRREREQREREQRERLQQQQQQQRPQHLALPPAGAGAGGARQAAPQSVATTESSPEDLEDEMNALLDELDTFGDEHASPAIEALGRSLHHLDPRAELPPAPAYGTPTQGTLTASMRFMIEEELHRMGI